LDSGPTRAKPLSNSVCRCLKALFQDRLITCHRRTIEAVGRGRPNQPPFAVLRKVPPTPLSIFLNLAGNYLDNMRRPELTEDWVSNCGCCTHSEYTTGNLEITNKYSSPDQEQSVSDQAVLYASTTALERFLGRSTSTPCSMAMK
jgi:hypothetical protein